MEDRDEDQLRQQLINFGHTQWGFNHWSWTVTKQDLDFVDFSNGKYTAGVAGFVSVVVKSLDIQRENVGYATCTANTKGSAVHRARKCAVTNALRETLISFGGTITTDLKQLLAQRELSDKENITNKIDNDSANKLRKEYPESGISSVKNIPPVITNATTTNNNNSNVNNGPSNSTNSSNANIVTSKVLIRPHTAPVKATIPPPPPMAKALPMPMNLPRPPIPRHQPPRPNPNVSFVLQPVMQPPLYGAPPRMPPPQMYPNYYDYSGPWFTYEPYERHHGNVNLNFNIPPKNLVVNNRSASVECRNTCRQGMEGEPMQYGPQGQNQGCWVKPTIFYDGFWTEQKVKKWVAEQVEKQFPDDGASISPAPSKNGHQEPPAKS